MKYLLISAGILLGLAACLNRGSTARHEAFVSIKEVIPDIQYEIRYHGSHNFIGRPITGYHKAEALLTKQAAAALKNVQGDLKKEGFSLKVFDGYRPQMAVDHFVAWAKDPGDTVNKREFYPDVPKSELFKRGYIASKSGHTRGSTVDLTVIDLNSGKELDMGGTYDFFGEISHHGASGLTPDQKRNRTLLLSAMERNGFKRYSEEWWHYTLKAEPFPDTYFNFPVQ